MRCEACPNVLRTHSPIVQDDRRLPPPLFYFLGKFRGRSGGEGPSFRRLKWPIAADGRASFSAHSGRANREICGQFRIFRTFGRISGRRANPILLRNRPIRQISTPRFGIRVAQGAARIVMRRGAHASLTRRIYGPPDDRAMGGLGVRRAVTAFTIPEECAAPPPDIQAPRAALRIKLCIGNEAIAHLPNVYPIF